MTPPHSPLPWAVDEIGNIVDAQRIPLIADDGGIYPEDRDLIVTAVNNYEKMRKALEQALRQWKMYAEIDDGRDIASEKSTEGDLYRGGVAALASPGDGLRTAHQAGLESVARYCARDVRPPSVDDQQYRELIANIVEALEFASAQRASPSEPSPAKAGDGWVKVDESHPLPDDLGAGDEILVRDSVEYTMTVARALNGKRAFAYRRRPSAEQGG